MTQIKIYSLLGSLLLSASFYCVKAQVTIGSNVAPNTNALLDLKNQSDESSTKGLLLPRVGLKAINDTYPMTTPLSAGMVVYNTATAGTSPNNVIPGYYYYDGQKWVRISGDDWHLTGNAGTTATTNFLGTTDNVDLVFKRNNLVAGVLGSTNTSYGYQSLVATTTTSNNTAIGVSALSANTGSNNVGIGHSTMENNSGGNNVGIGNSVLKVSTGGSNVGVGFNVLQANTAGILNTSLGAYSLTNNTTGSRNTVIGDYALSANDVGVENVVVGDRAAIANTGSYNTVIGPSAMVSMTSGNYNIGIGYFAGNNQISGFGNIIIGNQRNVPNTTGSCQLNIGDAIFGNAIYTSVPKIGIGYSNTLPTETLEVYGAVKVGTTYGGTITNGATTPVPFGGAGTIVFQSSHFFGWTGSAWKQLDNL